MSRHFESTRKVETLKDSRLIDYAEYWDNEASEFLLVSSEYGGTDLSTCLIFHKASRCYESIDDSDIAREVMARMRDAGVPVVHVDDLKKLGD